jgi:hypothetical protein
MCQKYDDAIVLGVAPGYRTAHHHGGLLAPGQGLCMRDGGQAGRPILTRFTCATNRCELWNRSWQEILPEERSAAGVDR